MGKSLSVFLTVISLVLMASTVWAQTMHSPNGYSITAPRGWTFSKSGMMGSDMILITKPRDQFANNLNVRLTDAPAGVTLAQVQGQLKAGYPKMFKGYKFIADRFTSVGGQRAYELICNHKYGTPLRTLWVRQDMVIRGSKLYVFTCTALASNADHYTAAFDRIIKSVRWTGK